MKWIISAFALYVIFSAYYIQTLKDDNNIITANNAVLSSTIIEQNKTIDKLFKFQNSQLEVLQNLDKEKEKIYKKYEGLNNVVNSDDNSTIINDFNVIIDRLWE
ncbi:TPA: hypothetical protein R8I27_001649 [Campylobacter jejuni]|nr:hypothetical protein [Campylobacter jejuni]HED5116004.1 hypothetical protein [Campylobacter jejuni]HEF3610588.1 hypothetical protein [Campylobacter jejuni]HEF3625103.1 hypothetical protein [Campylobacter jejuni]HEG8200791.1 hypothetical protein [Campylobacter jejuni]